MWSYCEVHSSPFGVLNYTVSHQSKNYYTFLVPVKYPLLVWKLCKLMALQKGKQPHVRKLECVCAGMCMNVCVEFAAAGPGFKLTMWSQAFLFSHHF